MSRSSNTFLGLLIGIGLGSILGILYAPDKGSNTRDKLSFKLDKYKDQLEDLIKEITEGKHLVNSNAKAESEKVINDAKEKAERLLDDVDELIDQIRKK